MSEIPRLQAKYVNTFQQLKSKEILEIKLQLKLKLTAGGCMIANAICGHCVNHGRRRVNNCDRWSSCLSMNRLRNGGGSQASGIPIRFYATTADPTAAFAGTALNRSDKCINYHKVKS